MLGALPGDRGSSLESWSLLSLLLWVTCAWAPGWRICEQARSGPTQGSCRAALPPDGPVASGKWLPPLSLRFLISDSDEPYLQGGCEGFRVC